MSTDLLVSYEPGTPIFDAMVKASCFDPTEFLDLDVSDDYLDGGWPVMEPLDQGFLNMRDAIRQLSGTSETQFWTSDMAAELRLKLANDPPPPLPVLTLDTADYSIVEHDDE